MKLATRELLVLGIPLLLTACATIGPPKPPSLELPRPPKDLQAVRKGGEVILTWTIPTRTTDRQTIRKFGTTRICRGLESTPGTCNSAGETVAKPGARVESRQKEVGVYIDTLPASLESGNPAAFATYAVEVKNPDGRSAGLSNQVRVPLLRTEPPPQDFRATVTKEGIVVSWSGNISHPEPSTRYLYRVHRRLDDRPNWTVVGEVPAGSDTTLTDSSLEWEKTYGYRIETVTVTGREGSELRVEGADSAEVRVFADDVFPPAVPAGLQAVFSGPGQAAFIDLIWAPVPDVDLNGYNVYRREEGTVPAKINTELIKAPAFRDANVVVGKQYFYSVSAVDLRGNESLRSEETSEQTPQ